MRPPRRTAEPLAYSVDGAVAASGGVITRTRLFLLLKSRAIDSRKEGKRRIISGNSYRRYVATGQSS